MYKNICFTLLIITISLLNQSCCTQAGRNFMYEVIIKSSSSQPVEIEYTIDFGNKRTKNVSQFPYYEAFGYNIKCKDIIPQITIKKNDNSIIRVIMCGDKNVTVNNVDYYSLSSIYEIEKAGNTPPISSDSIMNYYKNTNNPNYMELSANEMTKTLTLNE